MYVLKRKLSLNERIISISDFLSHSSCFREIALSESACASDYNSIMSEVVTNTGNQETDNSTDTSTEPNMDHTIKRLCWCVFVANF